jgi:hypothetical protein
MNEYNAMKQTVKQPPYNTGKVVIGLFYEPKQRNSHALTHEEEFWQVILTSKPLHESIHVKWFWIAYATIMCVLASLIVVVWR